MKIMKHIKSFLLIAILGVSLLSQTACDECDGENPRARIVNSGTKDASVQIKTSGGNTENLNNVASGTTSDYRSYSAGLTTFTISVDKVDYVKSLEMSNCYEYEIKIDANNNITTSAVDRNE